MVKSDAALFEVSLRHSETPFPFGAKLDSVKLRRFKSDCDPLPDLPVEHLVCELVYAPPGEMPHLVEVRREGCVVWWRDRVRPWWISSLQNDLIAWNHVYPRHLFLALVTRHEVDAGYHTGS